MLVNLNKIQTRFLLVNLQKSAMLVDLKNPQPPNPRQILNVDHAVGDGISMIGLLMSLYDEGLVPPLFCSRNQLH